MAYYAFINDDNTVTEVIAGNEETTGDWETYYSDFRNQTCVRTSYNTSGGVHYTDGEPSDDQSKALRYNYAGIGFTYDENRDAFIPLQPYASWVLDEATCLWVAPIAYPAEGVHTWDEEAGDWVEVPEAEVE